LWNLGTRFSYRVPGPKRVRRVEVDPRGVMPDLVRTTNSWPR
jgi:hypothetical protein